MTEDLFTGITVVSLFGMTIIGTVAWHLKKRLDESRKIIEDLTEQVTVKKEGIPPPKSSPKLPSESYFCGCVEIAREGTGQNAVIRAHLTEGFERQAENIKNPHETLLAIHQIVTTYQPETLPYDIMGHGIVSRINSSLAFVAYIKGLCDHGLRT